jgi:hypothetical protein
MTNLSSPLVALAFAGALTSTASAQAGWTQWSGNGHYYQAVYTPQGVTWQEARDKAIAAGADLATITSAAENAFVFSLVSNPVYWTQPQSGVVRILGPWLGGFQPPGSGEPNGSWTWVSGEPWGYTNWSPGEPNKFNGTQEDNLQFFTLGTTPAGRWNDLNGPAEMRGFVMESATLPGAHFDSYGTGCSSTGGSVPTLLPVANALPKLGTNWTLEFAAYPGSATVGLLLMGLSNTNQVGGTGTTTLPFNLASFGWPTCRQLVSLDIFELHLLAPTSTQFTLSVPSDPSLVGRTYFLQGAAVEVGQIHLSAGLSATLGT